MTPRPVLGPKLQLSFEIHKALEGANLPEEPSYRMAAFVGYRLALSSMIERVEEEQRDERPSQDTYQTLRLVEDALRELLRVAS